MWLPSLEQAPKEQAENPVRWKELNPEYEIQLWEYDSCRELIERLYPEFLVVWEELTKPIMQADLARLLIIHSEGGGYLDMDLVPLTPLKLFWDDSWTYNKLLANSDKLPEVPSKDKQDKNAFKTILSREHCRIDAIGVGIANGVIFSEPGVEWIMDFCIKQKFASKGKVLDFVGTWALTRYLRSRLDDEFKKHTNIFPPHYFLWETKLFRCPPAPYTIAIHPEGNSWGDHSKKDWWNA